ncbi:MAG TPA: antibiotic biosynthesis monooxygenase family protein [Nitrososphaeraceae archaeon]|jgi:quinol monooxygenase YgiN|nr:antibiotic biosynthesis monooxygenase family protein [Nitrososphaeraceae archaeon]
MAKFVEMDYRVKFKDQIEEKIIGSVILINKFNVEPNKVEQFLKDWGDDAINFKQQPGFISAQLHKGIGQSSVFINYAVWESMEYYKQAINKMLFTPESQSPLLKYDDDSLIISPHLFKKVAVPGICED